MLTLFELSNSIPNQSSLKVTNDSELAALNRDDNTNQEVIAPEGTM